MSEPANSPRAQPSLASQPRSRHWRRWLWIPIIIVIIAAVQLAYEPLFGKPADTDTDVRDVPVLATSTQQLPTPATLPGTFARADVLSPDLGLLFRLPPALCRLSPNTSETSGGDARCTSFPDALMALHLHRRALTITPTDDSGACLVAAGSGRGPTTRGYGVYSLESGVPLLETEREVQQSFATKDGHVAVLTSSKEGHRALVRRRPDGSTATTMLHELDAAAEVGLFWDQLVWSNRGGGARAGTLAARQLKLSADPPLGPIRTVGKLEAASEAKLERAATCRSDQGLFVGLGGSPPTLAAFDGTTWRLWPIRWPAPRAGLLDHLHEPKPEIVPPPQLACHGRVATLTELVQDGVQTETLSFVRARCALYAPTCEAKIYQLDDQGYEEPHVAAVGEAVLLVYERDGIRLRVGPPDQLQQAPEQLILDTGLDRSVLEERIHAFSYGTSGFVLVSSDVGEHVLRVAADGAVSGVQRASGVQ